MSQTTLNRIRCLLLALFLAVAPFAGAAPETAPAPTTRDAERQKVMQLTRRSMELFQQKKLEQVEAVLKEALALEPGHPTNLYNMACVLALTGREEQALDYLERSCEAGYVEFVHMSRDTDLAKLRQLPRYQALVARKDEFQKRYAGRAVEALRKQFGEGYLYEIDEESKLIFATNTDAPTLAALRRVLSAQAKSQWEQVFSHKPDQYIAVVLPSGKDYRRIVRHPGVGGFYNPSARILISRQLGQIMTHEFTHVLHHADLEASGQEHPIWLLEGMASLWEAAQWDVQKQTLVPQDNFRLGYIQGAARTGKLIPLDKLLRFKQPQFIQQSVFAYGQAGSVLLYLYEKELLKKFYDTYKAGFEGDLTGIVALEAVTGQKLKVFEAEWRTWLLKREPPAAFTGPDGAFMGVRFAQAHDGIRIDEVLADQPAAKAGVKLGDVVVGLDEVDVRDYPSFLPLLNDRKPGDVVTLKVRRGVEYLDLAITLGRRDAATQPSRRAGRPE